MIPWYGTVIGIQAITFRLVPTTKLLPYPKLDDTMLIAFNPDKS
jgi:hypothetical protein